MDWFVVQQINYTDDILLILQSTVTGEIIHLWTNLSGKPGRYIG